MHLHETLENTAAGNRWTQYGVADKAMLCACLLLLALVLPPWPWAIGVFLAASAFACLWARVPLLVWARAITPITAFGLLGILPLIWMDRSSERAIHVTLRSVSAGCDALHPRDPVGKLGL
jgi:energy-coupling factor transporter transmembrane protein EcfT